MKNPTLIPAAAIALFAFGCAPIESTPDRRLPRVVAPKVEPFAANGDILATSQINFPYFYTGDRFERSIRFTAPEDGQLALTDVKTNTGTGCVKPAEGEAHYSLEIIYMLKDAQIGTYSVKPAILKKPAELEELEKAELEKKNKERTDGKADYRVADAVHVPMKKGEELEVRFLLTGLTTCAYARIPVTAMFLTGEKTYDPGKPAQVSR